MKFTLTFKTPDLIGQAVENLSDYYEMMDCTKKFIEYGETITVEFDSELGTATVLPVKRR